MNVSRIVLVSSLLHPLDYQQWIRRGEMINPSHQQYMQRLMQAFHLHLPVTVLSLPPRLKSTKKMNIGASFHRKKDWLHFQFPFINLPILRPILLTLRIRHYVRKLITKSAEPIWLVIDTNSALAGIIAKPFRHHARITTVGVITDDPSQLTGSRPSKVKQSLRLHRHYHRYISLNDALLKVYGVAQRPACFVPGLVETPEGASRHPRPYFFFSGALYARYGIGEMIRGFLNLNLKDVDLMIAGHGPEASFVETMAHQHRNIKFLGLLSPKEVSKFQAGAFANVNPRPLDAALDAVSIPSKVLDYLSTGVPTITTEHPFIKATFGETCTWIEEASVLGIQVAMKRFIEGDYGMHQANALKAQKLVFHLMSTTQVGQRLFAWINDSK
jgi:glycosyltransferase involved in cell wall biosynthesis